MQQLTESQKQTIIAALDDKIALWRTCEKESIGWVRLQRQYRQQIAEAEVLIEILEYDDNE